MMWVNFIVLTREFLVTSVRLMAAGGGKVVAANIYGKIKTVSQMVSIIMALSFEYLIWLDGRLDVNMLTGLPENIMRAVYNAAIWFSALMAVISGIVYAVQNRDFIKSK